MALPVRVLALAEQDRREREGRDADRDVHEEDPLPREQVGEDPAREDACCGAEAADRTPRAERDVALAPLGERGRQDREGSRRDGRRAQSLERAGDDQRRVVPGEPAEQRADREDDDPDHEHDAPPDDVRQAATEQEEAAEHERVGADDPLQVVLREPEIRLDRRERDVDDRDVEDDDELRDAEKRQRKPFHAI